MRSDRLSGQITVFLSLLLTIFISLIFSLFYSAIIAGKRTMAENEIDIAMDSMFAQYNRRLLEDYNLFYIDMNEAIDDANGNLRKDLSYDDAHLLGSSFGYWYDFLKTHAIAHE